MSNEPSRATGTGRALARVGLLGNPSDGYGGRVIAMTVPSFSAAVDIASASTWDFGDSELLAAAVNAARLARPELVQTSASFTFTTTIPRQVGLAGSSAIIIAGLRALADRAGSRWNPVQLAKVALEAETEILGWTAGPQDRVVQSIEGLVDMDFATPWHAAGYEPLDTTGLPALYVAWQQATGESSDVAHTNVRERWLAGDQQVVDTMKRFAELAAQGRAAIDSGTASTTWPRLLNEAFELRSSIWSITSVDTALVETGVALGAGVAFAGSGGAVVGAVTDGSSLPKLAEAYHRAGAGFLVLGP